MPYLVCSVVDVYKCRMCDIFLLKSLCVYNVAMVLGGNINSSCLKVFNRMISASVTVFHLMGVSACCKSHKLMSKTDGKDRYIRVIEFFDFFNNRSTFLRISRSVTEHDAVRIVSKISSADVRAG